MAASECFAGSQPLTVLVDHRANGEWQGTSANRYYLESAKSHTVLALSGLLKEGGGNGVILRFNAATTHSRRPIKLLRGFASQSLQRCHPLQ